MEFCSKYGYNYGFQGSDQEDFEDEDEQTKHKVVRKIRKADTNIIAVKFDQLINPNEMFAGEPKQCKNCEAFMTLMSKENLKEENNKKIWKCEFCYEENDMTSVIESVNEIPTKDDVTFLLEPAPVSTQPTQANIKSTDDGLINFCIDVSGSMDTMIDIKRENSEIEQTDMTRLEGVKIASIENLKRLKDEEPNKKVSLVTFSDQVKYYGDCTDLQNSNPRFEAGDSSYQQQSYQQQSYQQQSYQQQSYQMPFQQQIPQQIANNSNEVSGDCMYNKEKLISLGHNVAQNIKPISESANQIKQRVKFLHTEGSTALGPGLAFSIGIGSRKSGSQIILCTDGCANVGIGSVENGDIKVAEKFYEDLADYAKNNGVTVNVISMEGTDCKLALLGKVADRSNGTLTIVNPLNLSDEFKSILGNKIVATNVKAKLIVNKKYLYIRDEQLEEAEGKAIEKNDAKAKEELDAIKKSIVTKDVGNANIDTEITFEYGIRKLKNKDEQKDTFKELPFQLQISYTTTDGAKAVRVYTKKQEFTGDRKQAEQNLNSAELIYSNAAQKMSEQVLHSNVRIAKFRNQAIQYQQQRNNWSAPQEYQSKSEMVNKFHNDFSSEQMNDIEAQEMYGAKKMSRSKFSKK